MSTAIIIFLIVLGFVFLLVEIFITPGIILGVIGLLFMAAGIYQVYGKFGATTGNYTIVGVTFLSVALIFFAMRSGVWDRLAQKDVISGKANLIDEELFKIGDTGKAVSALRPSGNALINGQKIEVATEGQSIESQEEIQIIKIRNKKIIVKKVEA